MRNLRALCERACWSVRLPGRGRFTREPNEPGRSGRHGPSGIGMSFVALANVLVTISGKRRFHSERWRERSSSCRTTDSASSSGWDARRPMPTVWARSVEPAGCSADRDTGHAPASRRSAREPAPYTVMLSNAGAGYSRYGNSPSPAGALDGTRDDRPVVHVRDLTDDQVWSVTHQPTAKRADSYMAVRDGPHLVQSSRRGCRDTDGSDGGVGRHGYRSTRDPREPLGGGARDQAHELR
jgi:hypothetical protein